MKKILLILLAYLGVSFGAAAQTFNILDRINSIVSANSSPLPSPITGTGLQIGGANGANSVITINSFGGVPILRATRADTSAANPSALQSGESILGIQGSGFGSTVYGSTATASINFITTQIWTDANQGTQLTLRTTPNNSTASAIAITVDQDQSSRFGGRIIFTSSLPIIGACGTSPALVGTDNAMLLTVGTGGAAVSCAATFSGTGFPTNAPICVVNSDTDISPLKVVTTTTTITVTSTTPFTASSHLHVICMGRI